MSFTYAEYQEDARLKAESATDDELVAGLRAKIGTQMDGDWFYADEYQSEITRRLARLTASNTQLREALYAMTLARDALADIADKHLKPDMFPATVVRIAQLRKVGEM